MHEDATHGSVSADMTRGMLLEVAFALVLAAIGIYQRRWLGDVLLVIAALILCYVVVTWKPVVDAIFSRPRTVNSFVVALVVGGAFGALFGALAWFVAPAATAETATPAQPSPADMLLAQTVPDKATPKAKEAKVVEPPAAPKKDQPPVVVGPGGAVSFGQQGGITAGTVNIQPGVPPPNFVLEQLTQNQPEGDLFKTEFMLKIESQVAVPNLYIAVHAPSITKMDAGPQRTGMSMTGHSGNRDGFAFTNLQNAYGLYKVSVLSKKPEAKFEVEVEPR